MTHTPEKIGIIMTQVKNGDTVSIHYTGTLNDGTTFDSSEGRDPLAFQVGSGQIIPGLDSAMPGMAVGDKKTVNVPCDQAYGPVNPDMRQQVQRTEIPAEIPTEVGTRLQMQDQNGQVIPVVVVDANETTVTLDANHPLAGQDLTFAIELVEIKPAA
jgi:FKBP-type peptidyl-prolyl cis-trans isomerase 2